MSKLRSKIFIVFCLCAVFTCVSSIGSLRESVAQEESASPEPIREAQEEEKQAPVDFATGRISLDLRDMDVIEALKFLAARAGMNIMTTKAVSGRVSLTVEDAPIKDIFDIMLRSNSLAFVKQADIYNVMTETEYKALFGRNFSDSRKVKMIQLKYAVPDQVFSLLDVLKSEIGRLLVNPDTGTVLLMDTEENIIRMQQALEDFDRQNLVKVFPLQYANALEVEQILKSQLDDRKAGFVKSDARNNQVIVQAFSEKMEEIGRLISSLDRQTKEVLIDVKIVKIKLSDQLDKGVEWEGLYRLFSDEGIGYLGSYPFSSVQSASDSWRSRDATRKALGDSVGSFPFSGTATDFSASSAKVPGEELHLGLVRNDKDLDLVFKMLQTVGNTRILSAPKIVATNNQEAKIHVGERQAYVTSTTTQGQTTSTIAEEVNFVDVGLQLSVTPTINDDGYVTMKIKPEISSVTDTLVTPSENKIPIIDTSMAETTVMVKDGASVILSGLRREEKIQTHEQVPILGSLPLMNNIFRKGTGKTERTELLIILTPHIISGMTLSTGDEKDWTKAGSTQYRDDQPFDAPGRNLRPAPQVEIEPKTYRDFTEDDIPLTVKEPRYVH